MRQTATTICCIALAVFGIYAGKIELKQSPPANTISAANMPPLSPITTTVHDTVTQTVKDTVYKTITKKETLVKRHTVQDTVRLLYIATHGGRKGTPPDTLPVKPEYVVHGPINYDQKRLYIPPGPHVGCRRQQGKCLLWVSLAHARTESIDYLIREYVNPQLGAIRLKKCPKGRMEDRKCEKLVDIWESVVFNPS